MYPGTAFTRSIGDAVAERIGVTALPEVDTFTLGAGSRFAVIASDGVFEFLPSQAVVDDLGERLARSVPQYADKPFHRILVCRIVRLTGWAALEN